MGCSVVGVCPGSHVDVPLSMSKSSSVLLEGPWKPKDGLPLSLLPGWRKGVQLPLLGKTVKYVVKLHDWPRKLICHNYCLDNPRFYGSQDTKLAIKNTPARSESHHLEEMPGEMPEKVKFLERQGSGSFKIMGLSPSAELVAISMGASDYWLRICFIMPTVLTRIWSSKLLANLRVQGSQDCTSQ